MTSKERHEARYQRRKAKRQARKAELTQEYGVFDKVFTFENMYKAYVDCCKSVDWKASTQRYKANALINITTALKALQQGNFKTKGFYEFDVFERGKLRHIKSVHISERVIHRCLCDYSMTPLFVNSFIYDNSACVKGKGIDFAANRLKRHLQQHYRKYGNNGYVLMFDFSKYFDNIQHGPLKSIIDKCYTDQKLKAIIYQLIDDFGKVGLGLGSQISQNAALMFPNRLDHYIKEVLRIKGYGRYMDDGYLIHHSKKHLQKCLADIKRICGELGIKLNTKKTQIIKLTRSITFLKRRFALTGTGKVIIKPNRKSVVRMRRKLKVFKRWLQNGKMQYADIHTSYVSYKGHLKHCNAYKITMRLDVFFKNLFKEVVV